MNLDINPKAWPGTVFIALISTAVAIIALSADIKMIGAAKASIISTFEPIEGVLLSIIILAEQLFVNQIFGVVLVITAIIAINPSDRKTKKVA
jgi:drug/metabolite transporter (DMT)-like permease